MALFVAERDFLLDEDADWIDVERRRLAELRLPRPGVLRDGGAGHRWHRARGGGAGGSPAGRARAAGESGYRCLMLALAAQGNQAEALRVYSGLCDTLRDELGVSPSADTRSVYEQLVVT